MVAEFPSKSRELQRVWLASANMHKQILAYGNAPVHTFICSIAHTCWHTLLVPPRLDTQLACGWSQCWVKLITQLNYRLWVSVRGLHVTFSKCQPVTALLAGLSICVCVCVSIYRQWDGNRAVDTNGIRYIENVSWSAGASTFHFAAHLFMSPCVCECEKRGSVNVWVCLKFV